MIQTSRRSLLAGLGATLLAAPAVARAGSLMPLRGVVMASRLPVTFSWRFFYDDTVATALKKSGMEGLTAWYEPPFPGAVDGPRPFYTSELGAEEFSLSETVGVGDGSIAGVDGLISEFLTHEGSLNRSSMHLLTQSFDALDALYDKSALHDKSGAVSNPYLDAAVTAYFPDLRREP